MLLLSLFWSLQTYEKSLEWAYGLEQTLEQVQGLEQTLERAQVLETTDE